MNYLLGWASLVMVSLWVSVIAFVWAVRNGQFVEQGRARYLPLRDTVHELDSTPAKGSDRATKAMLVVFLLGLAGLLSVVLLALFHPRT